MLRPIGQTPLQNQDKQWVASRTVPLSREPVSLAEVRLECRGMVDPQAQQRGINIFTMTRAAEHKDEETGIHVQRISYYCRDLARILGLEEEFVDRIFFASPMHDIGKIGIPDHVLLKPSDLTPEEWEVMKGHTSMGAMILGDIISLGDGHTLPEHFDPVILAAFQRNDQTFRDIFEAYTAS